MERHPMNVRYGSPVKRWKDGCKVSVHIWEDPEFTGLTLEAQRVWFYRVSTWCREPWDSAHIVSEIGGGATVRLIDKCREQLRPTKYGDVLNKWPTVRRNLSRAERWAIFQRDGFACKHCGTDRDLSIDHIFPFSLGGTDDPDNLQTLCRRCNLRKSASVTAAHE